jgi:hypothetical protein
MAQKRAPERWESKIENCEAYCETPHKEGWTKGTNCNSWSFRPSILSQQKKANLIANFLENLFTPHKVCDTDHERQIEA